MRTLESSSIVHGSIEAADAVAIRTAPGEQFYYSRSVQPLGAGPRWAVPAALTNPIARVAHGRYFLNRYSSPGRPGEPDELLFSAPPGGRLVLWSLDDGEQVCFRYEHVVGFCSGLKLRTIVNLQLASMAALDLTYSIATGPGRLLLETGGIPILKDLGQSHSHVRQDPFSPGRLVAWSRDGEFRVTGSGSFADIYLSGLYLVPTKTFRIVLDGDTRQGRRDRLVSRVWRIVRRAYRPW